ncbi:PAS domain-containing sensor histidine kinase [Dyella sp. LX-66]|uniref:two-component system sensor histidine kinase NtrB n=1 Tax=unclassified Dyella TaxID=2634549 RepID=UPI001BDFECD9|nr:MULTISPECIES: ATP-binding protein [unclassified Dyella]MBT2119314.1 PAS domain-containing sensor histidine kinase [Dyella sp. LX-1]MBT2141685.1 PAS domain-containing sensor histidine kinase [Dyella sp. LX-66]
MDTASWRAWAEPMSTGLALVDAGLRVLWINPALAEWLDTGPRSAAGQPLGLLLHEPDWFAQAERALSEQRAVQLRGVALRTARGREWPADVALQPIDGGLLLEVHVLAPAAPAASPLSATLRGFAHEVKNPLAGLRGAAQLLQRRVADEDLKALAGLVIAEADRLASLANRLLHHDGAPRLGPVNIHEQLEWLTDLLQAEPEPPQLRHDYDPSLPDVKGDTERLQQVLLNLARNAVEAGARTLTLRTRVEHGLRVGERMLRTALRVDVADDGPGVPAALRDTLFEPLVSGRADGSGLGLALAREIAREHGGELRYASRPGETVFSLYLPLERTHE